jgi:hypothetical protein
MFNAWANRGRSTEGEKAWEDVEFTSPVTYERIITRSVKVSEHKPATGIDEFCKVLTHYIIRIRQARLVGCEGVPTKVTVPQFRNRGLL